MLHRCKNGHECWRELPQYFESFSTCSVCPELLFPCPDPAAPVVAPPKGAKYVTGCPKKDCHQPGWWLETNSVQYGEQNLTESWEAWCPEHGWYGAAGSSGPVFDDERLLQGPVDAYVWMNYHGYTDIDEWRRHVLGRC